MRALRILLGRAAGLLATLVAVSFLLFAGSQLLPGDAAAASLGPAASPEMLAERRAQLRLDEPLLGRYAEWLAAAARGDLGVSLVTERPVADLVGEPLAFTALLVAVAGTLTLIASVAFGVTSGLRPGSRLDRAIGAVAVVTVSIPNFVLAGLLVILFAGWLGVLPAVSLVPLGGSPLERPEILVLPVASLWLFATAWASQLVRASVVDANASAHVEAARLAGLPEHLVLRRHLLPATVPACAQAFAWLLGGLVGGTAVVERVFNYPGLSGVLIEAVRSHDPPVLEAVGLLMATALLAALLIADAVGLAATPRLRRAGA